MKTINCGKCEYLHYIPRTILNKEGVQLVCGKLKKEIIWFESHRPFSDNFQPEWCPRDKERRTADENNEG